jgi:hypothetical protein
MSLKNTLKEYIYTTKRERKLLDSAKQGIVPHEHMYATLSYHERQQRAANIRKNISHRELDLSAIGRNMLRVTGYVLANSIGGFSTIGGTSFRGEIGLENHYKLKSDTNA